MRWARLALAISVFEIAAFAASVSAQPTPADTDPPILRHSVPSAPAVGETLVIQTVVEDTSKVTSVTVWYRPIGAGEFRAAEASKREDGQRLYETSIAVTDDFLGGLEYYVSATDQFENRGTDGTDAVPYLVEVRALPALAGLTGDAGTPPERPWWKRRWVWVIAIAVVAGGIAVSANRDDETGTIVVE